MKEKEPNEVGYIEKDRKHRDRTKKRRLRPDEGPDTGQAKPRMEPYKRVRGWSVEDDNGEQITETIFCNIHEKYYDGWEWPDYCPYCKDNGEL